MSGLVKLAPAAALYTLGLAAEVSGYTDQNIAIALVVVATLLLLFPAWPYICRARDRIFARSAKPTPGASPTIPASLSPRPVERDVWLLDAIGRAFHGRWERVDIGWDNVSISSEETNRLSALVTDGIRQLALDSKLPIWGAKYIGDVWHEIPKEYWADHRVDWFAFLRGRPEELVTQPVSDPNAIAMRWTSLMTSKAKVEELWPAPTGAGSIRGTPLLEAFDVLATKEAREAIGRAKYFIETRQRRGQSEVVPEIRTVG